MNCTGYQIGDWREYFDKFPGQCHCPNCGGFIQWVTNYKTKEREPVCNKCKIPLIALPDDPDDIETSGRICPIGEKPS